MYQCCGQVWVGGTSMQWFDILQKTHTHTQTATPRHSQMLLLHIVLTL